MFGHAYINDVVAESVQVAPGGVLVGLGDVRHGGPVRGRCIDLCRN